jgi:hypothetical protein
LGLFLLGRPQEVLMLIALIWTTKNDTEIWLFLAFSGRCYSRWSWQWNR